MPRYPAEAENFVITAKQKRYLRGLAHDRKVIVQTGAAGLTNAVLAEIGIALTTHELVKVRVVTEDRTQRDSMIAKICREHDAQIVQKIGHVVTVYRPNEDSPKIVLP